MPFLGLLLCLAAYLPRLAVPFAWDDRVVIERNPAFDRPFPAEDMLSPRYFSASGEMSWRPLATWSYAALSSVFGKSPTAFRGASLLLHLATGLLLASFLAQAGWGRPAAASGAALFLVHPAHVETLMCASFNEEPMMALGLLALLCAHQRGRTAWATLAYAAAMLAKEPAVLGLPLAAAYDRAAGRGPRPRAYAAYAAVLAAYVWLEFFYMRNPGDPGGLLRPPPLLDRVFSGSMGLVTAVRLFFLPVRLRLDYFSLPAESSAQWLAWTLCAAALLALWAAACRRLLRKDGRLAYLLAWPLPFLFGTANLIPLGILTLRYQAERWLYVPYLGWAALAGWLLRRRPGLAAAVLLFWGTAAFLRAGEWRREAGLWEGLLRIYPWSAHVEELRGEALFGEADYPGARAAFERALRLRERGEDRIIAAYAAVSKPGFIRKESPTLLRWLGRVNVRQGDLERAGGYFDAAARLDPGDGYTYGIMAYHLAAAGDFRGAGRWLERGLRAKPDDAFLLRLKPDLARGRLSFQAGFH